jgi:hypothetical protein
MKPLKLIALDEEDLAIVAAHLQDAIVKVADIIWRPDEQRLVLPLNRFDWTKAHSDRPDFQRRRAALRFERVAGFQAHKITPTNREAVLNLLTIGFAAASPPGGQITLTYSGGIAMRLDVECIEAELVDLGPAWQASCPQHTDAARTA